MPPVIGKISEPALGLASPTMPGVSLSEARASVKPLSSLIAVVSPVSSSMEATGLGAGADLLEELLSLEEESLSLPQAESGRPTRATVASPAIRRFGFK